MCKHSFFNKNYFWFYFVSFWVKVYTTVGTYQFKLGYFEFPIMSNSKPFGFALQSFTIASGYFQLSFY